MKKDVCKTALTLAIICLLCAPRAHAYLDPGTWSMLLQALVAGGIAVLAFGRQIYTRVSGLFSSKKAQSEADGEPPRQDTPRQP